MIMAKGIANGLPLSGIVANKSLMDKQNPGSMGGTYSGNAVACAAGIACAEVMQEENILANVEARSQQLFTTLKKLQASPKTSHLFHDIRGKGLMVGCEFASPDWPSLFAAKGKEKGTPKGIASRVQKKCLENDMLTLTTSVYETIRFIPMLNVTEEEMKIGCEIFEKAVEEVAQEG